ncbi:hypothetical protein [Amycolatopsis sp. NPDC003676]
MEVPVLLPEVVADIQLQHRAAVAELLDSRAEQDAERLCGESGAREVQVHSRS